MISLRLIQSIRHKDVRQSLMTSMQHHLDSRLLYLTGQHLRLRYRARHGFHHAIILQASKIRGVVERVASQSSEYEKDKEVRKYKLVEDLIYGLN